VIWSLWSIGPSGLKQSLISNRWSPVVQCSRSNSSRDALCAMRSARCPLRDVGSASSTVPCGSVIWSPVVHRSIWSTAIAYRRSLVPCGQRSRSNSSRDALCEIGSERQALCAMSVRRPLRSPVVQPSGPLWSIGPFGPKQSPIGDLVSSYSSFSFCSCSFLFLLAFAFYLSSLPVLFRFHVHLASDTGMVFAYSSFFPFSLFLSFLSFLVLLSLFSFIFQSNAPLLSPVVQA
jgi:hypothetical protein